MIPLPVAAEDGTNVVGGNNKPPLDGVDEPEDDIGIDEHGGEDLELELETGLADDESGNRQASRFGDKECPGKDDTEDGAISTTKKWAEVDCTTGDSCLWCEGKQLCRGADLGCPGKELFGSDNCVNENEETADYISMSTPESCTATDPCLWCDDRSMCHAADRQCPRNGENSGGRCVCIHEEDDEENSGDGPGNEDDDDDVEDDPMQRHVVRKDDWSHVANVRTKGVCLPCFGCLRLGS